MSAHPAMDVAANLGHRLQPFLTPGEPDTVRWTCRCGATLAVHRGHAYGRATEVRCAAPQSPQEGP